MEVKKKHLDGAVEAQIITEQQADALFNYFSQQTQNVPGFAFTHVLYYLGGLLAIGAMTLFMNLGWSSFGGAGILFISLLYAGLGLKICNSFAARQLFIPAGICATFVVCLTPLAIFGLQQWLGLWPDDTTYRAYHRIIKWHWLYMELGTLLVGTIVLWKYKYPFLVMPLAVTLWYMSMDVTLMLSGDEYSWELRQLVSMYFGLSIISLAIWVDIRSHRSADYAFWLYIFGVCAFWGGLSLQHSDSEVSKFIYFCVNIVMIGIGVLLVRRVFVVFGALGCCGYLAHLASNVFEDSWLFPVALTLIGFSIIYLGVLWQKHERTVTQKARSILPQSLQMLLDSKR